MENGMANATATAKPPRRQALDRQLHAERRGFSSQLREAGGNELLEMRRVLNGF